jgi:hypothetical protein
MGRKYYYYYIIQEVQTHRFTVEADSLQEANELLGEQIQQEFAKGYEQQVCCRYSEHVTRHAVTHWLAIGWRWSVNLVVMVINGVLGAVFDLLRGRVFMR